MAIDETVQGSFGTVGEVITEYWSEDCDTLPYLLCLPDLNPVHPLGCVLAQHCSHEQLPLQTERLFHPVAGSQLLQPITWANFHCVVTQHEGFWFLLGSPTNGLQQDLFYAGGGHEAGSLAEKCKDEFQKKWEWQSPAMHVLAGSHWHMFQQ